MQNTKDLKPTDLGKLHKTPLALFDHYGLPVVQVPGVINPAPREFHYDFDEFPRVELVAKRYYENEGNLVMWSEGKAFSLLREAVRNYVIQGLLSCYEYTENFCSDETGCNTVYDTTNEVTIHAKDADQIASSLFKHIFFDVAVKLLPPRTPGQLSYYNEIVQKNPLFKLVTTHQQLSDLYTNQIEKIKNSLNETLPPHIKAVTSEFSASGEDKYSSAPYIEEFLLKIIEHLDYHRSINPFEVTDVPCDSFDLLVFNPIKRNFKFVEVKNKDKFTHNQLFNLISFFKNPVVPIELCLVQAS